MTTKIFKDYSAFVQRDDQKENGVTQEFADNNPSALIEKNNEGCWNCSRCSGCSRCSRCSGCSGCSRCSGCSDCSRCSDCSGCSRCSDCSGCSDCSRCSGCSGCSDCSGFVDMRPAKSEMVIPKIKDIHQKILAAVTKPDALDMSTWHTCNTTHCRGGWVVTLAGKEGQELEKQTSTVFAAMQIYHKSSPEIGVSPSRFYDTDEQAMKDMVRCAELEKAALK